MSLQTFLDEAATRHPERTAVEEVSGRSITYVTFAALTDKLRDRLAAMGVKPGDRVGFYMPKSIDAVASIYGILKTGAAYVPVDPTAPTARNAYIFSNCQARAVIVADHLAESLRQELEGLGASPAILSVPWQEGEPLQAALETLDAADAAETSTTHDSAPDDLAYILYTSGSTGKPKGVMLTHENAVSFVDWCSSVFEPTEEDRFSSHAPFHFDLSVLDVFLSIKHGAALNVISEAAGKEPVGLAQLISDKKISIWYSTPSILGLLTEFGKLEEHDYASLRIVLFAGEVFPVKHLRALKKTWAHPVYYNLYGPTETNVCTYHKIPDVVPEDREEPYPIGKDCEHYSMKVVDENGATVRAGEEGELLAAGPAVMQGYWDLHDQTTKAFVVDADGERWYRTGDIVVPGEDGIYTFLGRRDRMIKKRGYRIELGEIEACLYGHDSIKEVGVVAQDKDGSGVTVRAFITADGQKKLSMIELKQFCSQRLPTYMVPDFFTFEDELPRTSTGKVDYQKLRETH